MNQSEKIEFLKTVHSYINGDLNPDEIDELWKLFLTDREAFELFETELHLRSYIREQGDSASGVHELPNNGNVSQESSNRYKMWVLSAAAVFLIVIGMQFFSIEGENSPQDLAITDISSSDLVGAELLRSDEEQSPSLNVMINRAVAEAYEGDYPAAIQLFEQIRDANPEGETGTLTYLNLGILYYNTGQYQSSADSFRKVVNAEGQPDHRYEKAWWFMGNAYLNLGEMKQAREAIYSAYTLDGRFNKPALALLKKIDLRLGGETALPAPEQLGR